VVEYCFRWSTVWDVFKQCQLFDFENQSWRRFDDRDGESAPNAYAP